MRPLLKQSIFVAIEVAYDEASSDPGAWATPGQFAAFLTELLSNAALKPLAGEPRLLSNVSRVRLFSHSGGYAVLAALAEVGGVDAVLELNLLDSLYGEITSFDSWVQSAITRGTFGTGETRVRFNSLYTDTGGTEVNNRAMATRVQGWLASANASALLHYDDTLGPLQSTDVARHPIIFKRSNHTHDDTCRVFFAQLIRDCIV